MNFYNNTFMSKATIVVVLSCFFAQLSAADASLDRLLSSDNQEAAAHIPLPKSTLSEMSDNDMQAVSGQALFDISQRTGSDGMQFLRFLMNAKIDTNLNIEELKLGPDSNPDLHLTKMTLSGGTGPDSYAEITRPFLELALSNFGNQSQKALVGLRIGSESASGVLGIGEQDASADVVGSPCNINGGNSCNDNGIEIFHGYLRTEAAIAEINVAEVKLQEYLNARANGIPFNFGDGTFVNLTQYTYPNQFLTSPNSFYNHKIFNDFYSPDAGDGCGFFGTCAEQHGLGGQQDNTLQGVGSIIIFGSTDYGGQLLNPIPSVNLPINIDSATLNTVSGPDDSLLIEVKDVPFHTIKYSNTNDWSGSCAGQAGPQCVDNAAGIIYDTGVTRVGYVDNAIASAITENVNLRGEISGLEFDSDTIQELRFVHNVDLSSSSSGGGLSLSLQSQPVHWPGATVEAQRGYWLAIENPIALGDLGELPKSIYVDEDGYREIEVAIERGLLQNSYPDLTFSPLGVPVNVGNIDLNYSLIQNQDSLPLGGSQTPPNNCYGGIDCF